MTDDEKIDLSALDPSYDPARWTQLVEAATERALARRLATLTVSRQLSAWAQPTLALAAALSLMVWAGALLGLGARSDTRDPVEQLSQWAVNNQVPSTTNVFETFGVAHGPQ
jgi:hypothetical protein